ncbi:MAG: hypothetical protein KF842_06960 [Caulobacter sp.]|nr:hypothetical protein [Caulobacter sp.]
MIIPALTAHQRAQLLLLIRFSAGSRRTALDVYRAPDINPGTMARLQAMGLTVSAREGSGRTGQRTVYWLSPEGMGEANRLRNAARGMTKPTTDAERPR